MNGIAKLFNFDRHLNKYAKELLFYKVLHHKPAFHPRSYRLGIFAYISCTTLATALDPSISQSIADLPWYPRQPRTAAQCQQKLLGSAMPGSLLRLQRVFAQNQICDVEEYFW